jgi:50S ribosomal subunit-associated GTPase HflX
VREEVRLWDPALLGRPQLVAATKRDAARRPDPLPELTAEARRLELQIVPVSAVSGAGLPELRRAMRRLLETAAPRPEQARRP